MMMAGGGGGGNGYEKALQSFSMLPILFGLHYYHVTTTTTTTEMPAATMCSSFQDTRHQHSQAMATRLRRTRTFTQNHTPTEADA